MKIVDIYKRIKQEFPQDVEDIINGIAQPYIIVKREAIKKICEFLKQTPELTFNFLTSISGVDDGKDFWVVYHIYSIPNNLTAVLKTKIPKTDAWTFSLIELWRGADWLEREVYDMFGIRFEGHKDLRRILLPEDWEGHPLRKDYKFPDDYKGIWLR